MTDPLRETVESLRREVQCLRGEVHALRDSGRTPSSTEPSADHAPAPAPPASALLERRSVVTGATAVLAGAFTGSAAGVLSSATPADAANGDTVTCGQTKTASAPTELRYNGAAQADWNLFTVQDTSNAQTNYPSAISGIATSDVSFGVQGQSTVDSGSGVLAYGGSQSYGMYARGGRANVLLQTSGIDPVFRADAHQDGELLATAGNGLWFCTNAGSPGSWRCLAGPDTAGSLHVLDNSLRVYDSRPLNAPLAVVKGPLVGGERTVDCGFGGDGAREGSTAVLVNLTVVNTSNAGWMSLFRAGNAWPGTSSLNWFQTGSVVANIAIVPCSIQALIQAKVPASTSADFVVDLIGYFR